MTNATPSCSDSIEMQIWSDGYIQTDKLQRKWLVSQMLKYASGESDFNKHFFADKPYVYEWHTTLNEIHRLSKMSMTETRMQPCFFTASVIEHMIDWYETILLDYARTMPFIKLVRYKSHNILTPSPTPEMTISDLQQYIMQYTTKIKMLTKSHICEHNALRCAVADFIKDCPMPNALQKSSAWMNAFQGEGSYCALIDLTKFYNFRVIEDERKYDLYESLNYIDQIVSTCDNDYMPLYSYLCKFIKDNNVERR